jgi:hypothetical protein
MKYLIWLFFLASLTSIICGFSLDVPYSEKLIGFGTLGLVFIVFPLFSYRHWKGKNVKDYMLTQENLDKMKDSQKRR